MTVRRAVLASAAVPLLLAAHASGVAAQTLSYPDFSSTAGLQLNGNAFRNGSKLTLTPAVGGQSGSAFSLTTIPLSSNASFSTVFSFEILNRGGLANGADGLTFTIQTNASNVGGSGGESATRASRTVPRSSSTPSTTARRAGPTTSAST